MRHYGCARRGDVHGDRHVSCVEEWAEPYRSCWRVVSFFFRGRSFLKGRSGIFSKNDREEKRSGSFVLLVVLVGLKASIQPRLPHATIESSGAKTAPTDGTNVASVDHDSFIPFRQAPADWAACGRVPD